MKGLFLTFVILIVIIKYIYNNVSSLVQQRLIYVIGVYTKNIVDKKFALNIINLAAERGIDIIAKEYDSYFKLLKDCNNAELDFAIMPEDFYVDSYLGLNVFKEKLQKN